jgi:hypothetical protein
MEAQCETPISKMAGSKRAGKQPHEEMSSSVPGKESKNQVTFQQVSYY